MFAGLMGSMSLKAALLVALVAAGGVFYWHYNNLKTERNEALARVGVLTTAKEVQDRTIESLENTLAEWKTQAKQFQATLDALTTAQVEANIHARKLNDVLSKHDLERLSLAKPGLIERRINRGTADVFRMFESATSGRKDSAGGGSTPGS